MCCAFKKAIISRNHGRRLGGFLLSEVKMITGGSKFLAGCALALCIGASAPVDVLAKEARQSASQAKKKHAVSKKAFTEKTKRGRSLNEAQVTAASKKAAKLAHLVGGGAAASRSSAAVLDMEEAPVEGLRFNSSVVLVTDALTNVPVLSKNPNLRVPMASLTKMMTALVIVESGVDLDEMVTMDADDARRTVGQRSALAPGMQLSRRELLHIALMSSENRAAAALARSYPGGFPVFIRLMNEKALKLGMTQTTYAEATGLSFDNQSTARDLSKLVQAAVKHEIIRDYSTDEESTLDLGKMAKNYHNTNPLIRRGDWSIALQKTGFTNPAGRCQMLYAFVDDRPYIIVMLDATHGAARQADALRIKSVLSASQSYAAKR
jgi:D-alanyl-D-alanine endopeptidase (penicillin-binding protein 7)